MGVLLNADKIKDMLQLKAPKSKLKAIVDSYWMLELPYSYLCDPNDSDCFVSNMILNIKKYKSK